MVSAPYEHSVGGGSGAPGDGYGSLIPDIHPRDDGLLGGVDDPGCVRLWSEGEDEA